MNAPKFGGGSWSRTNIVYHTGTDLQSAAEHAISTIPPLTIIITSYIHYNCFRKIKQLYLEYRVRFELTILRICNPFPWTTRAPVHVWPRVWESNPLAVSLQRQISNLLHYHPAHSRLLSYYNSNAVSNPHMDQHTIPIAYEMQDFV